MALIITALFLGVTPASANETVVYYYMVAFDVAGNMNSMNVRQRYNVLQPQNSFLNFNIRVIDIDTKSLTATVEIKAQGSLPAYGEHKWIFILIYNGRNDNAISDILDLQVNASDNNERFWYQNTGTQLVFHLIGKSKSIPL